MVYEYTAADADEVPYRLDRGQGWQSRGYGMPAEPETWLDQAVVLGRAAARLAVPVLLLLVLLGASYLYADALFALGGLPVLIRDAGLARNDLILPGAWTCIHLTNRRLGPGYALAQLVAGLAISLMVILVNPGQIDQWVSSPIITGRSVLSFGAAFLAANFVGIMFFDGTRGPRWWKAPLAASFAASLVFSVIYYPAGFAGVTARWADVALVHFLVFFGMSVLLLLPYWLLRPAMRPIDGMNGY